MMMPKDINQPQPQQPCCTVPHSLTEATHSTCYRHLPPPYGPMYHLQIPVARCTCSLCKLSGAFDSSFRELRIQYKKKAKHT